MRYSRRYLHGAVHTVLFSCAILVAWPLVALDRTTGLTRYGRQTWQTESGLPQNTVHAILQTHDGYIWLATEGGVVRFDGMKFAVYDSQNTPQLRSNNVRSLFEDRDHALWMGTADGLTRFKDSKISTFTTDQGLPGNSIWSIYQDPDGRLSVMTSEGPAEFQSNRFKAYRSSGDLSNSAQVAILDRSGGRWTGTSQGLIVHHGDQEKSYTTKDGLPGNRISALYEDKEGTLWIGTDLGLARMIDGKIERFPPNDSLSSAIVLSIFEDREGSLWLGTESDGVTVLRDEKFTTYTTKEGLSDDLARCIFQDRNGDIWVGTNGGGLNRLRDHNFSSTTAKDGLSSNVIFALTEDANGNLLAGTPDGLNPLRNGRATVLTSADGLADDFVRSIYRDTDGSIWIGTRGGLSHWQRGNFKTYTRADGLASEFVGALLRDTHGSLWIATLQGLTRFRAGQFKNYTTKDGLSSNVITALYEDHDGILWIGTQGGGLNRLADEKISHFSSTADLPDVIYGILEDASQQLWIGSKAGIFRVSKKDLNAAANGLTTSIAVVSYGTADGLRVSECTGGGHPAAWKMSDGTLWFSTLKGVAMIDPQRAPTNRIPPPVVLESVTIDDQTINPERVATVPPGHSRFAFEYAGLSFIAPHKVRFKYKLEGFDHDWLDAGTRRTAFYTNISPGRYRFRVLARNNDGVWNESGASFAFRLQPRFYQTYWFDLLLFLAIAAGAYELYRFRVNQVEERFSAVLAERNRIAREIHDTLAQGFVAVSVQLEVVARMLSTSVESAQEHLKQARTLVQEGLSEARRSIWELRSQGPQNEDLASRLSKMASQVTSATPVRVQFEVIGTYRPLPRAVENELLSIGQEAVRNAVRHAEAKHVKIDLNFEAKKLRMTIADDGRGFESTPISSGPDGHFGLQGMRERAEQIGAELIVTSAPGEGTQVSVAKVIH